MTATEVVALLMLAIGLVAVGCAASAMLFGGRKPREIHGLLTLAGLMLGASPTAIWGLPWYLVVLVAIGLGLMVPVGIAAVFDSTEWGARAARIAEDRGRQELPERLNGLRNAQLRNTGPSGSPADVPGEHTRPGQSGPDDPDSRPSPSGTRRHPET